MKYKIWLDYFEECLSSLSEEERKEILEYYKELFHDKIETGLSEEEIMESFGDAKSVADSLILHLGILTTSYEGDEKQNRDSNFKESFKSFQTSFNAKFNEMAQEIKSKAQSIKDDFVVNESTFKSHEEIKKLKISLVAYDINIVYGPELKVDYTYKKSSDVKVFLKGNVLRIKEKTFRRSNVVVFNNKQKMLITLPYAVDVDVDLVAGLINMENMTMNNLYINSVSAKIILENLKVKSFNSKTVSGNMTLKNFKSETELSTDFVTAKITIDNSSGEYGKISGVIGNVNVINSKVDNLNINTTFGEVKFK